MNKEFEKAVKELDFKRRALLSKKKEIESQINQEWQQVFKEFEESQVMPFKVGQVLKMVKNGQSSRPLYANRYKEMVVYQILPRYLFGDFQIEVRGTWFNKERKEEMNGHHIIYGIGNPDVFEVSDNQEYIKLDSDK